MWLQTGLGAGEVTGLGLASPGRARAQASKVLIVGDSMIATAFGTSAWSSSVIVVPPGSKTAVSESPDQLKTCVVLAGQIRVSVHRSHFVMKSGGMFYIPAGNLFRLENMSLTRAARIAMSEFTLFNGEL